MSPSTVGIGIAASAGFVIMSRVVTPLATGDQVFSAPFSVMNDIVWPLIFGALVIVILELAIYTGA